MVNLTTDYLDKALKKQSDFLTKELNGYTDTKSQELEKNLKSYTDRKTDQLEQNLKGFIKQEIKEEIESLARMTSKGIEDVLKRLDVKERVERHERIIQQLAAAINLRI